MNPMTNVKNILKLNERELNLGIKGTCSWHNIYKDSNWIFIGGLHYELTEGDVICVFSQYGEVEEINLVRDKKSGKSKGFCFLNYEDKSSTILAVDNLNGIKLCGRTIRVDHVANYRPPKEDPNSADDSTEQVGETDEDTTKTVKHKKHKAKRKKHKKMKKASSEDDSHTEVPYRKKHTQKDDSDRKSRKENNVNVSYKDSHHLEQKDDYSKMKNRHQSNKKSYVSSDESDICSEERFRNSKSSHKKHKQSHSSSDEEDYDRFKKRKEYKKKEIYADNGHRSDYHGSKVKHSEKAKKIADFKS